MILKENLRVLFFSLCMIMHNEMNENLYGNREGGNRKAFTACTV